MSVEELSHSVREQFLVPIPKFSGSECVSGNLFTAWVMQESLKDKKRELYKSEHFSHAAFVEFGLDKIRAVWCVRENVQIIHIFSEEDCMVLTKLSDERGEWNTGYHLLRDRLQSPDVDFRNFCLQDFMQGIS